MDTDISVQKAWGVVGAVRREQKGGHGGYL